MAEPIPEDSVRGSADRSPWPNWRIALASLSVVVEVGLVLRVAAANLVEWYVRRSGGEGLCVFPDSRIYWELARRLRIGAPYEIVEWADIPHFALRTPGYPLFLALCQALFGERPLAVRLVQAMLGTVCVYLVYRLTREIAGRAEIASPRRWSAGLIAAVLAAVHPYFVLETELILSEAIFVPLMVAALWGQAVVWSRPGKSIEESRWTSILVAFGTGIAAGAAILVRPSWGLFVPVMLVAPIALCGRDRRAVSANVSHALIGAVGVAIVMGPWWARNASVYGRFVPTALWMGASLYDGLNPQATGASDMQFLGDRAIWPLDEETQDATLSFRALKFAGDHPMQAATLAIKKLGRYWSPWPNAELLRSPLLAVAGAVFELPILGLILVGAWDRRRDPRAWLLLAGPILYFCVLHMVFASSMRYRIPGEIPAFGLAAFGWRRVAAWRDRSNPRA